MLVRGDDSARHTVSGHTLVLLRQKFHGKMDALKLTSRHSQVAWAFSPARQQNHVELSTQFFHRNVMPHVSAHLEPYAFLLHLR